MIYVCAGRCGGTRVDTRARRVAEGGGSDGRGTGGTLAREKCDSPGSPRVRVPSMPCCPVPCVAPGCPCIDARAPGPQSASASRPCIRCPFPICYGVVLRVWMGMSEPGCHAWIDSALSERSSDLTHALDRGALTLTRSHGADGGLGWERVWIFLMLRRAARTRREKPTRRTRCEAEHPFKR